MADISFSQFDSADFPTIGESVAHSKENPFVLDSFSDKYITTVDNQTALINEPSNVLSSLIWMLEPYLVSQTMPDDERYMPERTAKRLYNSHDFWYVCMLINGCPAASEYSYKSMKVLPAAELYRIETFLRTVKGQVSVYTEDRDVIHK
jgi:hypothetical protein